MLRIFGGNRNAPIDINSRMSLFAAFYMGIVGPEVFIIQPGVVQGFVEYLAFTEQQAGYIASAEMWGIALTTIVMTFLSSRFNWRHVISFSLILVTLSNLASLTTTEFYSFGAWRFLAGVGCGGLVSLSFAVIGLTDNPDRNFGYYIMWVLTYGAFGLLVMPTAYSLVGMEGVILFFALFPACGLLLVRYLPASGEEHAQVEEDAVNLPMNFKALALAAMFCYFLAQGLVWAYLFLIGLSGGASEQQVANGLTLSQFMGIAGALTAALVGARFGRAIPLALVIIVGIIPLAFLFGRVDILVYTLAVCVYNYAWNVTHPYLLASMASFDRSGKVVVYAVAFQMLGLALGPAIAATVIAPGDYSRVISLGMLLFALSLVFILPPVLKQKKLADAAV